MGKRGPKPTPTAILQLHGSRQAEQRTGEVRYEPCIPKAPAWLSPVARAEWKRITALMAQVDLLAEVDATILAFYCETLAEYVAAKKAVEKEGMTSTTGFGNVIQNPMVGIKHEAGRQLLKAAALFGLSPADRASLGIAGAKKDQVGVMKRSRSA